MLKQTSLNPETCEEILNLLNNSKTKSGKNMPLSVSQVSEKLKIPSQKARKYLATLWRKGLITRSTCPIKKKLNYTELLNPISLIYYTYTVNSSSAKGSFITYQEWIKLKKNGVLCPINCNYCHNCHLCLENKKRAKRKLVKARKINNSKRLEQHSPKIKVFFPTKHLPIKMENNNQNFTHPTTEVIVTAGEEP